MGESLIEYRCREVKEVFGGIPLQLTILASLEETIDAVFAELQKRGEQNLLDEHCPYFGVIWTAGRALADYVAKLGPALRGKRVLEVGCGLALPSFVAAKLGAEVTASDYHFEVPRFLKRNEAANAVSIRYVAKNWRDHAQFVANEFDYILGSDLLYEAELPRVLAEFLRGAAKPETRVVIADPGRFYLRNFMGAMEELGFCLQSDSRLGELDAFGEKTNLLSYRLREG